MGEQISEDIVDDPWMREHLKDRLADDEQVVATADKPYVEMFQKYRTRYILTNRRLIRLQRGPFNALNTSEFSLSNITTINDMLGASCYKFKGEGGIRERINLTTNEQSSHFIQEFRKLISQ